MLSTVSSARRAGATAMLRHRRCSAVGHTLVRALSTSVASPAAHTPAPATTAGASASAASATAASASTTASAAAAPASSSLDAAALAAISAESLWLYRVFLRHARLLPDEVKRADALSETRRQFRETRSAHASGSQPDPLAAAQRALSTAYSKLSFMRMATPKHYQPRVGPIPRSYTQALALFGPTGMGESEHLYVYMGGEVVPAHERARVLGDGRSVVNSQGITDEQIKRHHSLVERMHFRGPHWAGKSKH